MNRTNKYRSGKTENTGEYPMVTKDIQQNPDKHIDQDFAEFPHAHSNENIINPKTKSDKLTAGVTKKDQSKVSTGNNTGHHINEVSSDGSASAFSASEGGIDIQHTKKDADKDQGENNY